ncbi:hypothetical protein BD410DRAFT_800034 [Rickenella mellea]|uniref:Myb-like domain-containing protein n=1 Tax=Rickenella mellea TaxID=50990 RepID=A0A4Y7QI54_9AGAM|nr:hypothetical protein BD410DRAFT_800034 [Rickenella mellea]
MSTTTNSRDSTSKLSLPSSSTFSFTAPYPASAAGQAPLKQRRVSLALPSSPRLFAAWTFRDDTSLDSHVASASSPAASSSLVPEKKGKMRKISVDDSKPSPERAIYNGEKRQRKKWSEEETKMLVKGCNSWGVGNWKAILNDPTLKFDSRSPVDLKDRFRTFFPDAYREHYPNAKTHLSLKVRSQLPDGRPLFEKTRSKKRRPFTVEEDQALKAGYEKHGTVWSTIVKDPIFQEQKRRSTDLRDRFRNAFPHLYQAAGYKPRSLPKKKKHEDFPPQPMRAATDDHIMPARARNVAATRRARAQSQSVPQSTACSEDEDSSGGEDDIVEMPRPRRSTVDESTPQPEELAYPSDSSLAEVEMHTIDPLSDPLSLTEFLANSSQSMSETDLSQAWSSDQSQMDGWHSATTTASPTSSQISTTDYFTNESPFRRDGFNMIGKSAWGPTDWLSNNPRLDPSAHSSSASSFISGQSPAPSSPFSFSNMSHGIMDRYDLYSTSFAHDFASEVGMGDSHSTFSDPEMFPSQSFRGFTHHSDYAGDLIFGARTHQPQAHSHMNFASLTALSHQSGLGLGLGLSGMTQPAAGINPMQLHTPGLPGIDELELSNIQLEDHVEKDEVMSSTADVGVQKDDSESAASLAFADLSSLIDLPPQTLEEIAGLNNSNLSNDLEQEMAETPPATPVKRSRSPRDLANMGGQHQHYPSIHSRSLSVPPSEHRTMPPPRPGQHHTEPLPTIPRSLSQYDATHDAETSLLQASSFLAGAASSLDALRPSSLYDLQFLDLHYPGSAAFPQHHEIIDSPATESRHGQALDLAHPAPHVHAHAHSAYSHVFSPGFPHAPPSTAFAAPPRARTPTLTRPHSLHQRGQSAVSPKDLLGRKGSNDNKRKRVSWDGGHG